MATEICPNCGTTYSITLSLKGCPNCSPHDWSGTLPDDFDAEGKFIGDALDTSGFNDYVVTWDLDRHYLSKVGKDIDELGTRCSNCLRPINPWDHILVEETTEKPVHVSCFVLYHGEKYLLTNRFIAPIPDNPHIDPEVCDFCKKPISVGQYCLRWFKYSPDETQKWFIHVECHNKRVRELPEDIISAADIENPDL